MPVNLPVHLPLVVIPDPPAAPGEDGANAEEEGQRARLEDAALGIPKRPALALEPEALGDGSVGQDQIPLLQRADVIERRLADDGVAREELVRRYGRCVRCGSANPDVDLSRGHATCASTTETGGRRQTMREATVRACIGRPVGLWSDLHRGLRWTTLPTWSRWPPAWS
jgi:hypothetical protein